MLNILKSSIPYRGPSTENLIEYVRIGLQKNRDHVLIIDSVTGRRWTGGEIEAVVSKIALYLIEECGVKKGDHLNIYHESTDEVCILILAIFCVGGVYNFLPEQYSTTDVHDTASALGCKILFSRKSLLEKVQTKLVDIEQKIQVVSFDEICEGYKNGCKTIKSLFSKSNSQPGISLEKLVEQVQVDPSVDFAVVQFSSGTTGKPKPIPRTHKNLCHLVATVDHEELMDLKPGIVMTGALLLSHRTGLWALLATVNCGNTFLIWTHTSGVEDVLSTIEKFKVNIFSSSLPLMSMLGNTGIKIKDNYDLSSWHHMITAGAKITNADLPLQLIKEFNLKSLRQCFGMTESGWVFLIEQSLAKDNYLSVGHVCPGTEVIVLDRETNETLGPLKRGELALRGPQIFPGYLTQHPGILNRSDFDDNGFYRIGDEGYHDESGLFFITGRYKELLILENMKKFFPAEIEEIFVKHPAVEDVYVVTSDQAGRSNRFYDIIRVFVTLKQKSCGIEKELLDFVNQRSPYVVIGGGIKVLEEFPRLVNGKVDKKKLASFE